MPIFFKTWWLKKKIEKKAITNSMLSSYSFRVKVIPDVLVLSMVIRWKACGYKLCTNGHVHNVGNIQSFLHFVYILLNLATKWDLTLFNSICVCVDVESERVTPQNENLILLSYAMHPHLMLYASNFTSLIKLVADQRKIRCEYIQISVYGYMRFNISLYIYKRSD